MQTAGCTSASSRVWLVWQSTESPGPVWQYSHHGVGWVEGQRHTSHPAPYQPWICLSRWPISHWPYMESYSSALLVLQEYCQPHCTVQIVNYGVIFGIGQKACLVQLAFEKCLYSAMFAMNMVLGINCQILGRSWAASSCWCAGQIKPFLDQSSIGTCNFPPSSRITRKHQTMQKAGSII